LSTPLRKTKAGLEGQVFWEEFPGTVGTIFEESYRRAMRDQVTVAFESIYSPLQRWFDVRAYPSRDAISLYFLDVTERKLAESTLAAERNVLEQIALGTALLRILETLALDTEAQSTDGMLCSVLLFDEAGKKLPAWRRPQPAARLLRRHRWRLDWTEGWIVRHRCPLAQTSFCRGHFQRPTLGGLQGTGGDSRSGGVQFHANHFEQRRPAGDAGHVLPTAAPAQRA
jgi:hypothetical protein